MSYTQLRITGLFVPWLALFLFASVTTADGFVVDASDGLFEEHVRISWTGAESKSSFFRVYRWGSSQQWELLTVASANDSVYFDTTGDPGQSYDYAVGRYSIADDSQEEFAEDDGSRIVFAPTSVAASDREFSDIVRVNWYDRSEVEAGFHIYRKETSAPDSTLSLIGSVELDLESYDDSTAVPGVSYDYCVSAYDAADFESTQSCDGGTRGYVLAPTNVQATDGIHLDKVVVTWIDQAADESAYRVYRDESLLIELPADTQVYEDTVSLGGQHDYCVVAVLESFVDSNTVYIESAAVCDLGAGGDSTLAAPTSVAASDNSFDDRIQVTWEDPSDLEDKFLIFRDGNLLAEVDANETLYDDFEIEPGDSASYCVVAVSDSGGVSVEVCDVGERAVVLAPTNVTASTGDYETHVELSWESSSTSVVLFRIERDGIPIKNVSGTRRSCLDHDIESGEDHTYEYCVIAITALEEESPSGCASGYRELATPGDAEATDDLTEDRVTITWTDTSNAEDGFYIYRQGASEQTPTLIGTTDENDVAFIDETGTPGVRYEYSVTAFDLLDETLLGESAAVADSGRRVLLAPTNLEISQGEFEGQIVLTWEDNSFAETKYVIERDGSLINLASNQTSYTDSGVDFGATHEYEVYVADAYGSSESVGGSGFTVILAPGSVSATETYDDRIVVNWVDHSEVETSYKIYRDDVSIGTSSANSTKFVDNTAVTGLEYEYCVEAVNGSQTSERGCDTGTQITLPSTATPIRVLDEADAVVASDGRTDARFGRAVAIAGNRALIGAPEGNNPNVGAGVVYSYSWDGTQWVEGRTYGADNPETGSKFGDSVVIDGNLALVSSPGHSDGSSGNDRGRAMIFGYDAGQEEWEQIDYFRDPDPANNELFGTAIALENGTAVISGLDSGNAFGGTVFVFEREGSGEWNRNPDAELAPVAARDEWGRAVGISGRYILIADPMRSNEKGAVAVYHRNDQGTWEFKHNVELQNSVAGDRFGWSLSVDGDMAIATTGVSPDNSDAAQRGVILQLDPDSEEWEIVQEIGPSADQELWGRNVCLSDGVALVLTSYDTSGVTDGRYFVYVEDPSTGEWEEVEQIEVEDMNSHSVCAMSEGKVIFGVQAIADNTGAIFPFELLAAPAFVSATDGEHDGRVQISWEDRAPNEDGYSIYRDGDSTPIAEVDANVQSYTDFDAKPGVIHEYCVEAFTSEGLTSAGDCDFGWSLPDGSINGRVSTRSGAPVAGASICLDPSPNRGVLLDGDEGYIRIDDPVMPRSELTAELWIRTNESDDADGTFLSHSGNSSHQSFTIRNSSNLRVRVNGTWSDPTGVAVNDGEWHHVAVAWQQSTATLKIYVDGASEWSGSLGSKEAIGSGGVLVLGRNYDASGLWDTKILHGQMDEVRLWNRVRTEDEIEADMHRSLTGQEPDLVGYWPMNSGEGPAIADMAEANRYGVLQQGAFWTDDGSPIEVCAVTDDEGNYSLSGILYGAGTTFKVIPSLSPRVFSPAFKRVALSTENPIQNEIAFTDISSFGVRGVVQFANTSCFVEGAQITVGGTTVGVTGPDGSYDIALQPGTHEIGVQLGDHTFLEQSYSVLVDGDVSGLDFIDTTTRQLSGEVGGGCDLEIGTVTVAILSENGCSDVIEIDTSSSYQVELLPQSYLVRVTNVEDVPDALDRANILAFFQNLGPQRVDLSAGSTTQDFFYRAPISIRVNGLPDPVCDGEILVDPENGVEFPAVPLIEQSEQVPLTIQVFEDYGNGNLCPVDIGTVTVFDEIMDEADEPVVLTIVNGEVQYTTIGNTPNIFVGRRDSQGNDRSYQKPITFVAEVEGQDTAQQTHWAMVTGFKPRSGTFVTAASEPIPLRVLRDPPGDNSYAYLEENYTSFGEIQVELMQNVESGAEVKIKSGLEFEKGIPGYTTETTTLNTVQGSFLMGLGFTETGAIRIANTNTERFSTSEDELFVGQAGDVYLGVGLNLIFAKTDELDVDVDNCEIVRSQGVTMGGDADEPFNTFYVYTDGHIRGTVIPQLEELLELAPEGKKTFKAAIENWEEQLDLNATLVDDAPIVENRSFSAGADFEYSETSLLSGSAFLSVNVYSESATALEFEFMESGTGFEAETYTKMRFGLTVQGGGGADDERTTGYVLSDDDIGDYFTVDVGDDKQFKTPTFQLRSGRSSCPWEPGTQPRDSTFLAIEPPVLHDVPPEEEAVFTVSLTNASPSEELREYQLMPIQTSNPSGAVLSINGQPFNSGRSFFVESGQTQEVTLTVKRGPRRYFYEDLGIQVVPPCEFEYFRNGGPLQLSDDIKFSVGFSAPCSDVSLFEPTSGWAVNLEESGETGDRLRLTLNDFELQLSETDSLESVGAEYRRVDTEEWFPVGAEVQRDDIPRFPNGDPKSVEILWDISNIPDGAYELQAFTRCSGGRAFSTIATGVIDRERPEVIGSPQPADTVLALGDEIFVTFNENIDCDTVTPDRVTLTYLDDEIEMAVDFEAVCNGRRISFTPNGQQLALLEGRTLTARVEGVEDIVGNSIEAPVSWRFEVRQGAFTWTEEAIYKEAAYRNPGTITGELVNGTSIDLEFELGDLPEWLSPDLSSGTVVAGQNVEFTFAIADTLAEGTHVATVTANVPDADNPAIIAPLNVRIDVVCMPPVWTPRPADFEHSMTAVVQLVIDGAISVDPDDIVAGFVGNQLRGVGRPTYVSDLDEYMVFMSLYSNRAEGENVRFQIFDASECLLYGAADRVLRFESDRRHGTPESPVQLAARETPEGDPQSISLTSGWTWFSVNKINQDMSIFNVLGDLNPEAGDLVKSQNAFSQFTETIGWSGELDNLEVTRGYAIRLAEAGTILHEGESANPEVLIPVVDGWNWIGYPPDQPMEVNTALANLNPVDGDVIKSQFDFAEYVESEDLWLGSLTTMEPGLGYKLHLDDALQSSSFLRYPTPTGPVLLAGDDGHSQSALSQNGPSSVGVGAKRSGTERVDENRPSWTLDRGYQFNMTVTALVEVDGVENRDSGTVLGAFVGGELRGVANLRHVSSLGKRFAFLMIHSDVAAGETIDFYFYDSASDEVLAVAESMTFGADLVGGTLETPFVFHAASSNDDEGPSTQPLSFSLEPHYPSPARGGATTLRWALPTQERVVVHLFDVRGRNLAKLVDESMLPGWHGRAVDLSAFPSGVYFYQMQAGSFDQVRKLTILR